MDYSKFLIDVKNLKIAASGDSVSQTIEGLLELNEKIPERWDDADAVNMITQKQFDESNHYESQEHRGEQQDLYEGQLEESRQDKTYPVQEAQFEEAKGENGGHRPEMWDKDDQEIRGHKNTSPLWHQVYKWEDNREDKTIENKSEK